MQQEIKQLSQIEHVRHRPSMYVGSIVKETQQEFIISETETKEEIFIPSEREYIPALIKIFNEIIDNSIDAFIKSNGKFGNKISVKMDNYTFECVDNGRGIPNTKMITLQGKEKYQAEVAFTEMLSGNNYDNQDEASLGTNGIGSKASSIFSKKSVIINDDGKLRVTITTKDNLTNVQVNEESSKSSGVHTKIWPDLEYFKILEIDEVHFNVIKERLQHLSIAYPEINFVFNSKSLRINPKKYFGMFNTTEILTLNENVQIAVGPSSSDQFEHFSLVNGLLTKSGGTHMDYLTNQIVNPIREKLSKKFKTIKPADIKSKLRVVIVFKNFMNARYTSQTKEQITNSNAEISSYLGDISILDKFIQKIQKNDEIMLPITELFLLREQAKQNAKLKQLNKPKKIKSEKYLPAIKNKKVLFLCEGDCLHEDTKILMSDYSYKNIKNINIGDEIISDFLEKETIKAKTKLLKETITIKTENSEIICGKHHRLKVFNRSINDFEFVEASEILKHKNNYLLLKSKININSEALKVISNNNFIIEIDNGIIQYTDNDFFIIIRNNLIIRIHSVEIIKDDLIILS